MELYHLLNRGVEKRDIFIDDSDRARFVHDLYEFNDQLPADNTIYHFSNPNMDIGCPYITRERKRLVDIHGWCLMKNHYHLLLSERIEAGIARFMRKLNVGYARHFNERHKRTGFLFQGKTKKILLKNEAQFNYILHYIHLNPLDYLQGAKQWRIRDGQKIEYPAAALEHLRKYHWSSYLDYVGVKNFPSILTTSLFQESPHEYERALRSYMLDASDTADPAINLE